MRQYLEELKDFPKKCDWVLLILCLITSAFGCVAIASATSAGKGSLSCLGKLLL